jgi:hypothetical protein
MGNFCVRVIYEVSSQLVSLFYIELIDSLMAVKISICFLTSSFLLAYWTKVEVFKLFFLYLEPVQKPKTDKT